MEIPLFGRYPKNHEIGYRIEDLKQKLGEVRTALEDRTKTDYRIIQQILLGTEEMEDDDYHRIAEGKRESNLKFIRRLIDGLDTEMEFLERHNGIGTTDYNNDSARIFSNRMSDDYADHIKEMSPGHRWYIDPTMEVFGLSSYRMEAAWEDIWLEDSERTRLDGIHPGLSEVYPDIVNDDIVMPLLCLAQLSPRVLFTLAS